MATGPNLKSDVIGIGTHGVVSACVGEFSGDLCTVYFFTSVGFSVYTTATNARKKQL